MKKPMKHDGKGTKAKDKSGVNKPMEKAKIPQKRPGVTVGVPTPSQKM